MHKMIGWLLAVLAGGAAGAAAAFAVPPGLQTVQGRWLLVELASRPVQPSASGSVPWFAIKRQLIEGHDGCNDFSGSLDAPGSIAATRRGCAEGALKLPLDLADPLAQLKAAKVTGDRLVVPKAATMPGFTMRKVP